MENKNNYKILIVEDEEALANVLHLKLTQEGLNSEICNDGAEALKLIKSDKYQLVLLDIILPSMDGFEILENLQKHKNIPRIVVMSNLGQKEDIDRAKKLGAVDFFIKSDVQLSSIVEYINKSLPK